MNRRTVHASASGVSVASVDAATLSKYNSEVHLRGVNDGVVAMYIDALGLKSLSLPSIIVNDEGNRERSALTACNAVLNIVDSTADDQMFRGSVSFMGRVIGIVLAPYADVTAYQLFSSFLSAGADGESQANTIAAFLLAKNPSMTIGKNAGRLQLEHVIRGD